MTVMRVIVILFLVMLQFMSQAVMEMEPVLLLVATFPSTSLPVMLLILVHTAQA